MSRAHHATCLSDAVTTAFLPRSSCSVLSPPALLYLVVVPLCCPPNEFLDLTFDCLPSSTSPVIFSAARCSGSRFRPPTVRHPTREQQHTRERPRGGRHTEWERHRHGQPEQTLARALTIGHTTSRPLCSRASQSAGPFRCPHPPLHRAHAASRRRRSKQAHEAVDNTDRRDATACASSLALLLCPGLPCLEGRRPCHDQPLHQRTSLPVADGVAGARWQHRTGREVGGSQRADQRVGTVPFRCG